MPAGVTDLSLEQGSTFRFALLWRQAQTAEQKAASQPGTPYDLTGASATMQIRRKVAGDILIELSSESSTQGTITLGGATGRVDIHIPDEVTSAAFRETDGRPITSAVYDLYITHVDGDTYRLLQGGVSISPSVTDPSYPQSVGVVP